MSGLKTLMTGLALGESPRWHDDRLWFSDWGAQEIIAVDLDGNSEVILRVPSLPFCIKQTGFPPAPFPQSGVTECLEVATHTAGVNPAYLVTQSSDPSPLRGG